MTALYKIYLSEGAGLREGPGFRTLPDALRYVEEHKREASFAIKKPDGGWHIGDDGRRAIFRRVARGTKDPG